MHSVLFLCTANSARSIIAEALLATLGAGRFRAHSAGSHASGRVHPLALETLSRHGYDITGLRSKRWDEFLGPAAPPVDFVITLCDPARQACPVFPGRTIKAHWDIDDPVAVAGSVELQRQAFSRTLATLRRRVQHLTGLPLGTVEGEALRRALDQIGAEA